MLFVWRGRKCLPRITKFGILQNLSYISNQMKKDVAIIEMILEQADIYGLRCEVRSTAMAFMKDNPHLSSGSAYTQAAYEWDIL